MYVCVCFLSLLFLRGEGGVGGEGGQGGWKALLMLDLFCRGVEEGGAKNGLAGDQTRLVDDMMGGRGGGCGGGFQLSSTVRANSKKIYRYMIKSGPCVCVFFLMFF